MNDDELIIVLREQRGTITMNAPVEQISAAAARCAPGAASPGVAAAVGAAAAAGVAVRASGCPPAPPPGPRQAYPPLAAWTVTRQADGSIKITLREAARRGRGCQGASRCSPRLVSGPACALHPASRTRRARVTPVAAARASGGSCWAAWRPRRRRTGRHGHPPRGAAVRRRPADQRPLPARPGASVAVSKGSPWAWCRPARSAPAASYPARDLAWPPGRQGPRGTRLMTLRFETGAVGDADDQAILREQPGHRLSPRLCAGRVQ